MSFVIKAIGTFLGSGYFPIAPATFASFVFLSLYWLVPGGEWLVHPIVAACTLVAAVPIATYLEKGYGHDAGHIVIDEVVGLQVMLVWAQPTALGVVAVFFLFRLLDIVKPFPAGRSQKLPRGYGVVCDDFLAGLYGRAAMIIIAYFYDGVGTFF